MSYNELITLIDAVINRNGVQAITGQVLNGVLKAMVQQLGAGYALGGVAHPTDDPGTPDAPVCYFASETGTYTNFDNLTIAAGELALLCYDLNDGWSKSVMYEGFQSVLASVDNNVGTPDVQVSYNNGVLSFAFENLKGNTGAAAGFGNVTASVDDQIGTPSVSVQESGPDTAKNLAFAFHNLKGETGVTSVLVSVDNTSGTPQCAVSLNGQQLTLAFTGLKGAQGDTGVSADYPITIVNNLTTNDPTSALSAAQGVQLESEISQLEAELYDFETVDGMQLATITNQSIAADGTLSSGYNYRACAIPNNGYTRIVGHGSSYNGYLVLAFYNSATPNSSSFISGVTEPTNYTDKSFDEEIPAGTVTIVVGYSIVSPATVAVATLYKKTKITDNLEQEISDLQQDVEDIQQDITDISQSVSDLEEVEETVNQLIESEYPALYTEDDFTLDGYYNNANSGRTSGYGYTSLPLINVRKGMTIYWHKWATNSAISAVGALWCYDNDGLPFDGGNNARISFAYLTTKDYDNGEFTYIIPEGCTQIGISFSFGSYPVQDGAYIQIGDTEISLTDKMKELVNLAVEQNEVTGDKSAKYYLKGNSNIVYSSSKKLGIIAAGQSNIDGRNSYSDLPPGFVNPNAKVRFCNNTSGIFSDFQVVDGGAGNDWSFDAIVYDLLTRTTYGNLPEIYVMKKSMGGTSIDKDGATSYHWTADYEYLSSETYSLLRSFEKTIRKGEDTQGTNFEIKAFLWHQGEGDADTEAVALRYYDNLKNMLAYVRGIVGNPRLQFFCGNLSENNHANPYIGIINAAYAQLASEDPYFHCVDMRNAVLEDSWHFNYEWSIYFGQKVYDLMIDAGVISGTKINPSEPE